MIRLHCEVPGEVYILCFFPVRQIRCWSFEATYKIKGTLRLTAKPKTHGDLATCLRTVDRWSDVSEHVSGLFSLCVFLFLVCLKAKTIFFGGLGYNSGFRLLGILLDNVRIKTLEVQTWPN